MLPRLQPQPRPAPETKPRLSCPRLGLLLTKFRVIPSPVFVKREERGKSIGYGRKKYKRSDEKTSLFDLSKLPLSLLPAREFLGALSLLCALAILYWYFFSHLEWRRLSQLTMHASQVQLQSRLRAFTSVQLPILPLAGKWKPIFKNAGFMWTMHTFWCRSSYCNSHMLTAILHLHFLSPTWPIMHMERWNTHSYCRTAILALAAINSWFCYKICTSGQKR